MSTNIKLSKVQFSIMIQLGGFLCNILGSLGQKKTDLAILFTRGKLPELEGNLASNPINKLKKKKIVEKELSEQEKVVLSLFLNEHMNNIIKVIKSLEDLNVLIDRITETVKHEIKKQEGGFLSALVAPLATSLVQWVISSVVKALLEKKSEEWEENFWIKIFITTLSFKKYWCF